MLRGESLQLNKSLERHLNFLSGDFRLGDALDVDTSGATSGQPLEFNGTQWVPGTDNTGP